MKTRQRLPLTGRNPESGVIAFAVAALWMVLFGLAAFAVDIGYRYQSKFGLQAAADASLRAAMPLYVSGNSTGAQGAALNLAAKNGYSTGVNAGPSSTLGANYYEVSITATPPSFFLGLFGGSTAFPLGATAVAQMTGGGGLPVILALGAGGLTISSNAGSTFNGDLESNGALAFDNGPTPATVNGSVQSLNTYGGPTMFGMTAPPLLPNVVTGTVGPVPGLFANPFLSVLPASFTCTGGTSLLTANNPPVVAGGGPGGTSDLIPPGTYCSSTNMFVSDAGTTQIYAPNVTFVSLGTITIGANGGATLSPDPSAPNQIVVYSGDNTLCGAGQSVNVGFNYFNITGSIYAPNGCIRAGGKVLNLSGAMVAAELALNPDPQPPGWTIGTGGGGGGGGTWKMYK